MKLEAQLNRWASQSLDRVEAVIKTAVQDMTAEMQTTRAQGGRMPVDTGFLRNSILGNGTNPAVGLAQWKPATGTYTLGWTANYAVYMDARYGFFRLGIQNWPNHVQNAIRKVQR